jgi:hypothetical protein
MLNGGLRGRFWLETGLAGIALLLGVVTVVEPAWIEALTGLDPDSGSGALEWLLVAVLFAVAAVSAVLAHAEWRHTQAAQSG